MHRMKGMTLVEVLVALVVLSVGMLGIAVMFVQSVRSSRSAILRTHAVNLVSDMADRIRANANAQDAYDMSNYDEPSVYGCAPEGLLGEGRNCSSAELAEDDLARWKTAVEDTLPARANNEPAEANVSVTPGPGESDTYTIRVAWREPNETDGANSPMLSYQSDVVLLRRAAVE